MLYIVIGLPASGKTTLISEMFAGDDWLMYDDFITDGSIRDVLKAISEYKDV